MYCISRNLKLETVYAGVYARGLVTYVYALGEEKKRQGQILRMQVSRGTRTSSDVAIFVHIRCFIQGRRAVSGAVESLDKPADILLN